MFGSGRKVEFWLGLPSWAEEHLWMDEEDIIQRTVKVYWEKGLMWIIE